MKEKTPGRLQESADCLRPRGGKAETTTEQTHAPCSYQPVPAFQVTLVTPIWRPDLKCAAVRWACQHIFYPSAKVVIRFFATWVDAPPLAHHGTRP
jgi:hypothetical protein